MEPRFSAMMMSFENTMVSPLNVSSQSAVDHQGSTAAGQRFLSFPSNFGTRNMDQEADGWSRYHELPEFGLRRHFLCER
jgi:hypothetical protein